LISASQPLLRVYAGRFKLTGAKSGTYLQTPRNNVPYGTEITGVRVFHGVLKMDVEIPPDKLTSYATFRVFAIPTKRACALLKC
jgi:hypothetical protein